MRPRVPTWTKLAAYAVPLCVLPSALWRFDLLSTGIDPACVAPGRWWEPYYIASLSAVSFGASLLTIGLVSNWGEIFPRWMPFVGGRRVPVSAAVAPACLGVLFLIFLYAWPTINGHFHFWQPPPIPPDCPLPWEGEFGWVVIAAYAPLLLWAPLLALVTLHYYLRRTRKTKNALQQKSY